MSSNNDGNGSPHNGNSGGGNAVASGSGAARRTVHACMQCRERKQKCGGVTTQATCTACQNRKVTCSFEEEARDPRYNPYLRIQSRTRSPTAAPDRSQRPRSQIRSTAENTSSGAQQQQQHSQQGGPGGSDIHDELQRLRNELQTLRGHMDIDRPQAVTFDIRQPTLAAATGGGLVNDHSNPTLYDGPVSTSQASLAQHGGHNPFLDHRGSTELGHMPGVPGVGISGGNTTNGRGIVHPNPSPTYYDPPIPPVSAPLPTAPVIVPSSQTLPTLPLPLPQSHPSPDAAFNGPMKVLQELGADDAFDVENHDPIARQILTFGEASMAFRLFFNKCHLNAPFLDLQYDSDMQSVRSRNIALFLNIIVVGARFWSHSSKQDTWLHPRYPRLVSLLDQEMSRLTLRPRPADICLETVQAWMIYSHWMPVDPSPASSANGGQATNYRSRFTESSVWQCLGLAMRWATLLGLDKSAHLPFVDAGNTPGMQDVRNYRTMLYLTESDHYLALSARRPPTLVPISIYNVLPRFLRGDWIRATDTRLASLIRVVQAAHVMGGQAESIESLEAFNEDVNAVEQNFLSCSAGLDPVYDKMGQHFPFTSLRWYRLAFASTLLPPPSNWRAGGQVLRMSVDWASQMLYHLSSSTPMTSLHLGPGSIEGQLEPDEDLVRLLSFAIDQYFVVIAYTASFLVLAWQNGAIDNQLQMLPSTSSTFPSLPTPTNTSSTLYRLVDLSSRTLRRCAPARGHPASRYADFLAGMAGIIAAGPPSMQFQTQADPTFDAGAQPLWDQDWLNLWQSSGLEQDWLFGQIDDN